MICKYKLVPTKKFTRSVRKSFKDQNCKSKLSSVLKRMSDDPFGQGLKTHKVNLPNLGIMYSTRVTGDIRIIWNFDKANNLVLILYKVGGHDDDY